MAGPYYVYSGAAGAGTGADWANAYTTLVTAVSGKAAGDVFYVANDHAESAASAKTIAFPGTTSNPNKVYCVNRSGSVPPVSADLRTTGSITTTGANSLSTTGSAYIYGLIFNCGSGAVNSFLNIGNASGGEWQRLDSCQLNVVSTGSASGLFTNGNGNQADAIVWVNTTVSFGATTGYIQCFGGSLLWTGSSSTVTGGTVPTTLFADPARKVNVMVDGVDLSPITGTLVAAQANASTQGYFAFLNCRLGAGVTPAAAPTSRVSGNATLQISDSTSTTYRQTVNTYTGALTPETTFIRTGGASDGITPISWKIVSTANPTWFDPFVAAEIPFWNTVTSGSKTVTVEIENGGTTLTNADVWLEVEYLGNASYPLASVASSGTADALATGTNIPTSSASWAGSLGSAVKQYLQVTITPRLVGYIRATVKVAKASQTLYVDPYLTLA